MTTTDRIPPFPDAGHAPSRGRMKRQEVADHLSRLSLFSSCSKRQLRHLAGSARQLQLEAGQYLFEEGQPAVEAYLVVAGQVDVQRGGRRIATFGPGDVVGELGLLLKRPHSATVTARTPIEVVALSRAALKDAVDEVPGLAWSLLEAVADRLSRDRTDPV